VILLLPNNEFSFLLQLAFFLAERRGFIKSHLTRKTKSGRKIQNQELQKKPKKKIRKPKKPRNRNNNRTKQGVPRYWAAAHVGMPTGATRSSALTVDK
jgi:hypothetical protein